METIDYDRLKQRLEADFRATEAEYQANMAALDRVLAAAKRLPGTDASGSNGSTETPKNTAKTDVDDGLRRGEVLSALRSSLDKFPKKFTWKDALVFLQKQNPGTDYKDTSVRQAVMRLVDTGEMVIAEQGRGRRLSVYSRKD